VPPARSSSLPETDVAMREFVKRLYSRYGTEGIVIPLPIRTIDVHDAAGGGDRVRRETGRATTDG
jgi:hypothetical protein